MSAKKQRWIISLKPELGIEVNMEKTLVVWRRLGKEHGEHSGFRVNTPDVVKRHLREIRWSVFGQQRTQNGGGGVLVRISS
jgi:hypothetical protein